MGAWGTSIFADDVAADVRGEFTDLVAKGLDPEAATEQQIARWREALDDEDDEVVVWLALAATQWKLGRVVASVRERALKILESGEDLRRWEENTPAERRERQKHLEKLKTQLESPAPPAKVLKPRKKSTTDFQAGDVATYRVDDELSVRFCVLYLWGDRGGTYARICLLSREDGDPFDKEAIALDETLGPHFTMVSAEPKNRITIQRRGVRVPETNMQSARAWNNLRVVGGACTWRRFPERVVSVLAEWEKITRPS